MKMPHPGGLNASFPFRSRERGILFDPTAANDRVPGPIAKMPYGRKPEASFSKGPEGRGPCHLGVDADAHHAPIVTVSTDRRSPRQRFSGTFGASP
jgi:hypothetical protein